MDMILIDEDIRISVVSGITAQMPSGSKYPSIVGKLKFVQSRGASPGENGLGVIMAGLARRDEN